jgi:hypothetical protein
MLTFILHRELSLTFALAFLVLVLPCRMFGQVDTGSISGTIKDTSGGTIAGAKVTLTNEGTGVSIVTTSSSSGEYSFSPVKIGTTRSRWNSADFRKCNRTMLLWTSSRKCSLTSHCRLASPRR